MEWIMLVAIVAVFFLLAITFVILRKGGSKEEELPYESCDFLFSAAERSFYGVMCQAVGDRLTVFGKVRVADIISPKKGMENSDRQKARNKISQKHFDFVLCNPKDLSIFSVVELDDSSHQKKNRIERDRFLDKACAAAGVTIHHFKAKASYRTSEISAILFPPSASELNSETPIDRPRFDSDQEPNTISKVICPKCSSELVKRTAKKGANKGFEFFACSAFPKCRFILEPDSQDQKASD